MLDMLLAFATYAATCAYDTSQPEFADATALKQAVHPILVHVAADTEAVIPNDTFLHEGTTTMIITGPNMVEIVAQICFFFSFVFFFFAANFNRPLC